MPLRKPSTSRRSVKAAADAADKTAIPPTVDAKAEAAFNLEEAKRLLAQAEAEARAAGVEVVAAPAVHTVKDHSATVWVGCKMPNGLMLQLHEQGSVEVPVMGGGRRDVTVHMRVGEPVKLKGFAVSFGRIPKFTIVKDFALTEVRRDFWEKWLAQNSKMDIVQRGLVFFHSDKESTEAQAEERGGDIKCGIEPLDPANNDPRIEKSSTPNLTNLETDAELNAYKHVA